MRHSVEMDPEHDVMYIRVNPTQQRVHSSKRLGDWLVMDLDFYGDVVGVEIIGVGLGTNANIQKSLTEDLINCQEDRARYFNLLRNYAQVAADAHSQLEQMRKTLTEAQAASTKDVLAKREAEDRVLQLEEFIKKAGLTVPERVNPNVL